jgi:hypothetical protein
MAQIRIDTKLLGIGRKEEKNGEEILKIYYWHWKFVSLAALHTTLH